MKSGYWMGMLGHQANGTTNVANPDHKSWKIVWNASGPPKLRHFLWSACKESLATKWVLYQRYCVPSSVCDRCGAESETTIHALCDCSSITPLWDHHPSARILRDAPRTTFSEFLTWLYDHTSIEEFSLLCSTLWAGCFIRNKAIFEGERCDPISIATKFHSRVADYNLYNSTVAVVQHSKILQFQSWSPPDIGWVKVNFDVHIGESARRGLGVVIRDHDGNLLAAGTRRIEAQWSVEASEAAAALFGMELALRLDYQYIQLEEDAINVVQTIEVKGEGYSPLHLLYDCIKFASDRCLGVGCSYVKRNGNTAAHCVARWDTGLANEKVVMNPFPHVVRFYLKKKKVFYIDDGWR